MDTNEIPSKPPSPWAPTTNPRELGHLGKGFEEIGELVAIMGRILIQGIDDRDPKTGKPNKEAMEDEVADVLTRIHSLTDYYGLDRTVIARRIEAKTGFTGRWLVRLPDEFIPYTLLPPKAQD